MKLKISNHAALQSLSLLSDKLIECDSIGRLKRWIMSMTLSFENIFEDHSEVAKPLVCDYLTSREKVRDRDPHIAAIYILDDLQRYNPCYNRANEGLNSIIDAIEVLPDELIEHSSSYVIGGSNSKESSMTTGWELRVDKNLALRLLRKERKALLNVQSCADYDTWRFTFDAKLREIFIEGDDAVNQNPPVSGSDINSIKYDENLLIERLVKLIEERLEANAFENKNNSLEKDGKLKKGIRKHCSKRAETTLRIYSIIAAIIAAIIILLIPVLTVLDYLEKKVLVSPAYIILIVVIVLTCAALYIYQKIYHTSLPAFREHLEKKLTEKLNRRILKKYSQAE